MKIDFIDINSHNNSTHSTYLYNIDYADTNIKQELFGNIRMDTTNNVCVCTIRMSFVDKVYMMRDIELDVICYTMKVGYTHELILDAFIQDIVYSISNDLYNYLITHK